MCVMVTIYISLSHQHLFPTFLFRQDLNLVKNNLIFTRRICNLWQSNISWDVMYFLWNTSLNGRTDTEPKISLCINVTAFDFHFLPKKGLILFLKLSGYSNITVQKYKLITIFRDRTIIEKLDHRKLYIQIYKYMTIHLI